MDLEQIFNEIEVFCKETHGSSNYGSEENYVKGRKEGEYAPLKFLIKKFPEMVDIGKLLRKGFTFNSLEFLDEPKFSSWYEKQFGSKLQRGVMKNAAIISLPNNKIILNSISTVHDMFEILRREKIIFNGKNLPTQLGEWYAKCIFGLKQVKSASQRGFDFEVGDRRVEVKVHWNDLSSPKGVKLRKTQLDLSDCCIVMYIAQNFMIREICFLDSDYVLRKFDVKGHTIFLKDSEISQYFFSHSDKHIDKVVNPTALLKYASPTFAMKLTNFFPSGE